MNLGAFPELSTTGDGLFLWTSGIYRRSDVYFAWVPIRPAQPIPSVEEWNFLIGFQAGSPVFAKDVSAAIGLFQWSDDTVANATMRSAGAPTDVRYPVGELSVTWVAPLRRWLMLAAGPYARIADRPWGPWVPAGKSGTPVGSLLFDPGSLPAIIRRETGLYGTYALERYTRWDDDTGAARTYFVGSFLQRDPPLPPTGWQRSDHGQVHLFGANLRCGR